MSLTNLGEWLYATPISTTIREVTWIIPNVQSIHILAIAIVVGSALATELRLVGVFASDRPVAEVLDRYLPWMRWALIVLFLTGLVLLVAEPGRTLGNSVFWTKMILVATASFITLGVRGYLRRSKAEIGEKSPSIATSKALAVLMLLVWCVVVFCGRFIAYT